MATAPYSLATCREKFYQESALIIQLGELLFILNDDNAWLYQKNSTPNPEKTLKSINAKENQIIEFYKTKNTELRRHLTLHGNKTIQMRVVRAVAYAFYVHLKSTHEIDILHIARGSILDTTPSAILEQKRVVSYLLVYGIFVIVEENNVGLPNIRLSKNILYCLFGGEKCLPLISLSKLQDFREAIIQSEEKTNNSPDDCPIKRSHAVDRKFKKYLDELHNWSPQDLSDALEQKGYVGNERARKKVCLAVSQHINRIKLMHTPSFNRSDLPPARNILLQGNTGCGKTHLIELIGFLIGVPFIIFDVTTLSEAGYIGEKCEQILSHLAVKVGGDFEIAETGIVCLDEIDKLMGEEVDVANRVSRGGVQRGLLSLISGTKTQVPKDADTPAWRSNKVLFDTSNLMWIGCGCFPLLDKIIKPRNYIGFNDVDSNNPEKHILDADAVSKMGMMSELFGRFTGGIISLDKLSVTQLREILQRNVIKQHKAELKLQDIDLQIEDAVIDLVVEQALELKTGARSLQTAINEQLFEASFQALSVRGDKKTIHLFALNGEIKWDLDIEKPRGVTKNVNNVINTNSADELQSICRAG